MRLRLLLPLFALLLGIQPVHAQEVDYSGWETFLDGVRADAREQGISDDLISAALDGLEPLHRVVKSDRKQAEFKMTLERYMVRRVSEARVNNGKKMLADHAELLADVSSKYDVQPEYIVAIWGMETNYGLYTVREDAIRALATLAYEGRRGEFFRRELLAALTIVDRGHIDLASMKGSWAGAMGQSQFMPTSYLNYAVDHDGDGRIDIWTTEADVFASIANYLAEHGWKGDHVWGEKVLLPEGFDQQRAKLTESRPEGCRAFKSHTQQLTRAEWAELGLTQEDADPMEEDTLKASLLEPDGTEGPAFLAYPNYKAILSYNCANLYALSVGHLADAIK